MTLKLYNVLTRRKELFKPLRQDRVGLYTCGPTVYNFAHIGNLRTYIFEDVLRRTLEYAGYQVRQVMNITDLDDKIIREAKRVGKSISEFVKPYERAFFDEIKKLNIEPAWKYPKATEHIKEMTALIQKLLQKGLAYKADGSVYFYISKFKKYGRLSHVSRGVVGASAAQNSGNYAGRIDADEYTKENAKDFVLWKGKRAGEPSWQTPFGEGRPGWHIECSAMSMKYLGSPFDIHAGGVDLIFPHHENEIAQSEGATGRPFVRFFIEGEHLLVEGQKMSKSLGNVYTLRDIEKRGFNPLAFRYLALTAHYRSKLNFTWESLAAAQNSLERLYDFIRNLREGPSTSAGTKPDTVRAWSKTYLKKFEEAISNDLDTPKALAVMWEFIHKYNKKNPSTRYARLRNNINVTARAKSRAHLNPKGVLNLLYAFDQILGLGLQDIKPEKIPAKILDLVQKREGLRKKKLWFEADKIRKEIQTQGYAVEDTPGGPKVRRK